MKLPVTGNAPTNQEIMAELQKRLPQYSYSIRVGRFVDVKKSFFIGASVIPKKKQVIVNGNFPSAGSSMAFMLFMIFTGILIGLIVWLAAWKSGQGKVADEVAAALKPFLAGETAGAPGGERAA